MSMISTRGACPVSTSYAILRGLAPDGGLYVPETSPSFTLEEISALSGMDYAARAVYILQRYLPDFTEEELKNSISGAYGKKFDDPAIAPLKKVKDDTYYLELWHGPTLAFKDMALQLLPYLLTLSARKNGENREIFILVATSGDTGKAALEGFLDVPGTRCCVFYPQEGVSRAQQLQMVTTGGSNTHVIAVEGNFDDAQSGVKKIFSDPGFAGTMNEQGRVLSSANSINYGRLVPQIVYYFSAYADLLRDGAISLGEEVNFCVPTGNFGDILAADYAKRAGLPIGKLICASNANNVLTDFITTGVYDISSRPFYKTEAPSMDILISSNLERLIFTLTGNDAAATAAYMKKLSTEKRYEITEDMLVKLQNNYAAGCVDADALNAEIARCYAEDRYLIDTHTAVASAVLRAYRSQTGDRRKSVVVSTASPYKFGPAVLEAIGGERGGLDDIACCGVLEKMSGVAMPAQIAALPTLPIRHTQTCRKDQMEEAILHALG